MANTLFSTIQIRRGYAADFTGNNPTLSAGEPAWELDTNKFKMGDGSTAWTSLPYFPTWTDNLTATNLSAGGVTATSLSAGGIDTPTLTAGVVYSTTGVTATNLSASFIEVAGHVHITSNIELSGSIFGHGGSLYITNEEYSFHLYNQYWLPSDDGEQYIGDATHHWKTIYVNNVLTCAVTASNLLSDTALVISAPTIALCGTTTSADSFFQYVGTGIAWEDLQIPGLLMGFGASAPDTITLCGAILVRAFDGLATSEQAFLAVQLPHRYKKGTDLHPHVHWCKSSDAAGDVVWNLEYTAAISGDAYPAVTTLSAAGAGLGDRVHDIMDLGEITGSGFNQSTMIMCRLYRDPTAVADTYGADAILLAVDFHYQVDSLGSDQEYTKSF